MDIPESFEWDEGNREKNWTKHRVTIQECEDAFLHEPRYVFPDTQHSQKEERFALYGKTASGRCLTVIFTIRKQTIRIISARDQSRKERKDYESKTKN